MSPDPVGLITLWAALKTDAAVFAEVPAGECEEAVRRVAECILGCRQLVPNRMGD
jgi:hypothetical protein